MKFFKSTLLIAILLPLCIFIGCSDDDDNGTGSTDEIPANLVDTWWYQSATMNGEPVLSYSEVSHNDLATTASMTFEADGTWEGKEYADSPSPIFTQSGTFTISGSTINVRRTEYDGDPVDPAEEFTSQFSVNGDVLTLTSTEMIMDELWTLVAVYSRE